MSINTIARFAGALVIVFIIAALFFVDRSTLPFNIWWIVGIGSFAGLRLHSLYHRCTIPLDA